MLDAVQLGRSGLRVSRLALGTMNFGEPGHLVGACSMTLDPKDIAYLEELYQPLTNLLSTGMS
jgi:aryl-alcohol dehydrogenase-like predicted oxidoreductase